MTKKRGRPKGPEKTQRSYRLSREVDELLETILRRARERYPHATASRLSKDAALEILAEYFLRQRAAGNWSIDDLLDREIEE